MVIRRNRIIMLKTSRRTLRSNNFSIGQEKIIFSQLQTCSEPRKLYKLFLFIPDFSINNSPTMDGLFF